MSDYGSDNEIAEDEQSEMDYDDDMDNSMMVDHSAITRGSQSRREPYTVLSHDELREMQLQTMEDTSDLFGVTKEESFFLLRAYGWDKTRLQEAWFDNDKKTRAKAGLMFDSRFGPPSGPSASKERCLICFEDFEPKELCCLGCGHPACRPCWGAYLQNQAAEGKVALHTKCPQHKCEQVVFQSVFKQCCDPGHFEKYTKWCTRSFVDDSQTVRWCPNPAECDKAAVYTGGDAIDVKCPCGYLFCFACLNEAHKPASCKTVGNWNVKNSAESENVCWIMANTKKCPQCHRPIEKNQGCNHMTCGKAAGGCGHEFCWLCLGSWKDHGQQTGGFYQCNVYEKNTQEGKPNDEEAKRKEAKNQLDKYMFYFERYMNHEKSLKFVAKERSKIEKKVQELHDFHHFPIAELQFLYDACSQIAECRRVLKWSYCHGYYLEDGPEKNLFEFLQKNLEENTDYLHELIERKTDEFFKDAAAEDDSSGSGANHQKFMQYRSDLTNYTNVTKKFLAQMLEGIEQGLTNVDAMIHTPGLSSSHVEASSSSSSAAMKGKPSGSAGKLTAPGGGRGRGGRK